MTEPALAHQVGRRFAGKNLGLEEETLASPSNPISQVLW